MYSTVVSVDLEWSNLKLTVFMQPHPFSKAASQYTEPEIADFDDLCSPVDAVNAKYRDRKKQRKGQNSLPGQKQGVSTHLLKKEAGSITICRVEEVQASVLPEEKECDEDFSKRHLTGGACVKEGIQDFEGSRSIDPHRSYFPDRLSWGQWTRKGKQSLYVTAGRGMGLLVERELAGVVPGGAGDVIVTDGKVCLSPGQILETCEQAITRRGERAEG